MPVPAVDSPPVRIQDDPCPLALVQGISDEGQEAGGVCHHGARERTGAGYRRGSQGTFPRRRCATRMTALLPACSSGSKASNADGRIREYQAQEPQDFRLKDGITMRESPFRVSAGGLFTPLKSALATLSLSFTAHPRWNMLIRTEATAPETAPEISRRDHLRVRCPGPALSPSDLISRGRGALPRPSRSLIMAPRPVRPSPN